MTIDAKMFRRRTNAKGRFIPMTKVRGFLAPLNPCKSYKRTKNRKGRGFQEFMDRFVDRIGSES